MADAVTASRRLRLPLAVASAVAALAVASGAARAGDTRTAVGDPTLPPPEFRPGVPEGPRPDPVAAPADPVRLQMIARNGQSRLAVLNGRSVHAGDELTISGRTVQVVAINDDSVVLKQDGQRQTLQLIPHAGANPVCKGNAPQPGACRRSSPGASR